ncbi:MAG: DUF362 domain-containing protein [Promethearchaeota archaeon]|jgi:uncharacterized protein (DUF362 family)
MIKVSLACEEDRYSTVLKALTLIHDEVESSIDGKKKILIKPNFVWDNSPLCATHVDATRAIIDFINQFNPKEVLIAEGSAQNASLGFRNYNYLPLRKEYGVELIDLDDDDYEEAEIYTRRLTRSFRTTKVRVAKTVLEADYRISPAVLKTHDTVITTLTLKNMVMGAVLDKRRMHQGYQAMNLNLYKIAKLIPVHLALIDGWKSMEGNGPVQGTAVETKLALASTDFVAADTVATKLMGLDPSEIGYLQYAAGNYGFKSLGTGELSNIQIIGEPLDEVQRRFKPHSNYIEQKKWHISPKVLKKITETI